MEFNLEIWKQQVKERLIGWKPRFQKAGINSLYFGLTGATLLPVALAYQQGGEIPALMTLGGTVAAGIGANLVATKIQGWKDATEAQVAAELEGEAQDNPELKKTLDELLSKVETLVAAEQDLADETDKQWFKEVLWQ